MMEGSYVNLQFTLHPVSKLYDVYTISITSQRLGKLFITNEKETSVNFVLRV